MAIVETQGRVPNVNRGKFYPAHGLSHSHSHLVFEDKGLGPRNAKIEIPNAPETARKHYFTARSQSRSGEAQTPDTFKRHVRPDYKMPSNLTKEQREYAVSSGDTLAFGVRKGYNPPAVRHGKCSEAGGTRRMLKEVNETAEQRAIRFLARNQSQSVAQDSATQSRLSTARERGGVAAIGAADSLKRAIQSEQCRAELQRMQKPQRSRSADYLVNGSLETPYAICRNDAEQPRSGSANRRYYRRTPLPTAEVEKNAYDIINQCTANNGSETRRGIPGRFSKRPASTMPFTPRGSTNGQIPYDTVKPSVPYPDPPRCGVAVKSPNQRPVRRVLSPNRYQNDYDTLNATKATAKSHARASSPNTSLVYAQGIPDFMFSSYVSSPAESSSSDYPGGRTTFSRRKLHDTSSANPLSMNQANVASAAADVLARVDNISTGKRISPMKFRHCGSIY